MGNKNSLILFLIFSALSILMALPRILGDSLTADEPTDIVNGYYYLTQGDTLHNPNHPPLAGALTSWPLLFMNLKTQPFEFGGSPAQSALTSDGHRLNRPDQVPDSLKESGYPSLGPRLVASAQGVSSNMEQTRLNREPRPVVSVQGDFWDRAHLFLFNWNLDRLNEMTLWTRLTSLGMGLGVGFLIFWTFKKEPLWLLGALGLWAFDPLMGALSSLAKTDIAPAFFYLWAVLAFQRALGKTSWEAPVTAGVLSAFMVGCKFYGLVLIPLFIILEWLNERERFKPRAFTWKVARGMFLRWGLGTAGFCLMLFLLFLPGTLSQPGHPMPWNLILEKLGEDFAYAPQARPVFFFGQAGLISHWYYLPCAFVLKEPIPFLVLLVLILLLILRKRVIVPAWQWAPPLIFTLTLLKAPNLGVRYLLPVFPFLYLLGGRAWAWMVQAEHGNDQRAWRLAAFGLLAWQALSVGLQSPRAISYFNDWVPDDQKIFLLGDSNLDWGQDLKRLAAESGIRKWGRVKLALYGAVDPKVYGLDWEPWTTEDLKGPQAGFAYAVNASFLQIGPIAYPPTREIAQSWIRNLPPSGRVGETFYYFEIPGKKKTEHARLGMKGSGDFLLSAPYLQIRGYADPAFNVIP